MEQVEKNKPSWETAEEKEDRRTYTMQELSRILRRKWSIVSMT